MFKATTSGVSVTVMPVYIPERSNPDQSSYFWAYRVIIENNSGRFLKLISRYWKITDSTGHIEEVEGEGVVGLQPEFDDGAEFTYTSGCPLSTPSGIMEGYYIMLAGDGKEHKVEIPAFPLDLPDLDPVIN